MTKPGEIDSRGGNDSKYPMLYSKAYSRFKKLLFVSALVFILALTATAAPAGDKRVDDKAGRFSFIAPQGWSISRLGTASESTVRADQFKPEAHLTVLARPMDPSNDWDTWKISFKQALTNIVTDTKYGPYSICGQMGLAVVGQSINNPNITADRVAFHSGGVVYIITLVYPTMHWQRFRKDLEGVLSSFRCLSEN